MTWLAIALVMGAGLLCMLYAIAAAIRDFLRIEALKQEVYKLRSDYTRRLRNLRGASGGEGEQTPGEFDLIEDHPEKKAA